MRYVDRHSAVVAASPDRAWTAVASLGGDERFYAPRALWRARGRLERLAGGPGHRIAGPGRPLAVGDTMDFWRVVDVQPPARLRVRALSLLPGTAHLEIGVHPHRAGSELTVRTEFEPAGAVGHLFWWSELPAHKVVFELMTRRLAGIVDGAVEGQRRTGKVN